MSNKVFLKLLTGEESNGKGVIDISNGGKVLIISDLHMGSGNRDDLSGNNGEMLIRMLEEYYFKNGWILVLNGDIEELQRYSLDLIREKWTGLYRVFNLFAKENRLYKNTGNHDELLLSKKYGSYPYTLYSVLKIETGTVPAYVFHGHQLSSIYTNFNKLIGLCIRYILKPFGIKNILDARNPYKRFHIEREAYAFSIKSHCLSIIGHTHRPLFESLGRFDYIKFEIERLCRDYPSSPSEEKIRIENEVSALRKELGKLKRKERQDVLRQSLYGDELPVPCLFNSGCTLGKKGINAIEITNNDIALVYWFIEGKSKKFIKRGGYEIYEIPESPYRRAVLNQNKLDYILAKIKLLGNN
ncbi:MAG: serine/threonine protein phosphatase [Treponema sp.]|jgi:UDP-2,3-diacylglucosamine pyrophosphatase LpxH|nr:serine/threonine protein phosphatase [Treponema sp.]